VFFPKVAVPLLLRSVPPLVRDSELVLRQEHAPADKRFVDYAGQMVPIKDPHSGASAMLGFSSPCWDFTTTRNGRLSSSV
jgi:hypothetical protein